MSREFFKNQQQMCRVKSYASLSQILPESTCISNCLTFPFQTTPRSPHKLHAHCRTDQSITVALSTHSVHLDVACIKNNIATPRRHEIFTSRSGGICLNFETNLCTAWAICATKRRNYYTLRAPVPEGGSNRPESQQRKTQDVDVENVKEILSGGNSAKLRPTVTDHSTKGKIANTKASWCSYGTNYKSVPDLYVLWLSSAAPSVRPRQPEEGQ